MKGTALVVSVGGSHEPIITAIGHVRPEFVLFVCSKDDPVTGSKGSYTQVLGKGNIIKTTISDEKATLPNIPTQLDLTDDMYDVVKIDSDEIGEPYQEITERLKELTAKFRRVVCDYTGGTKSMGGALLLAAVDNDDIEV